MKDVVLVRVGDKYCLQLPNGSEHWGKTWNEARLLLLHAGVDPFEALASVVVAGKPFDLQYNPSKTNKRSWLIDGVPQPVAVVRMMLAEGGMNKPAIEAVLRSHKLCHAARATIKEIRAVCRLYDEAWIAYVQSLRERLHKKSPTV